MSKDREQSAIDTIYELLDEVRELRKEVKIIDSNLKLLNNKVSKTNSVAAANAGKPSASAPQISQSKESGQVTVVKLFGRIKNQARKPIKGVYIKIYDPIGNLVKSRETDSEGYWEARVIPGQYVVELDAKHINKNFIPKNINVSIDETMNEFEVK